MHSADALDHLQPLESELGLDAAATDAGPLAPYEEPGFVQGGLF